MAPGRAGRMRSGPYEIPSSANPFRRRDRIYPAPTWEGALLVAASDVR